VRSNEGVVAAGPADAALETLVSRAPLLVPATATVADAARAMRHGDVSSALVDGDPVGIVTDSDLRRVVAEELPLDTPVTAVMSTPVQSLPADTPTYSALLLMLEHGFKHVAVVDGGRITGMVSDEDLLRQQATSPLLLLGRIRKLTSVAPGDVLAGYPRDIALAARALGAEGIEDVRASQAVTSLNDALTGKLIRLAEQELGPPPCPYAWLELGSAGRREQTLGGDQDSAVVYAVDSPAARAYFPALAGCVVEALVAAGFPKCPGGHMATQLCRPIAEWEHIVRGWADNPSPDAMVEAEVFLDFRPVHGELSVRSLDSLLLTVAGRRTFLAQMARAATFFTPPLRRLGRVVATNGAVDVKAHGTAPIVLLARLYGVAAGSRARATIDRLHDAADAGTLSRDGAAVLTDAFRLLTRLRLRAQLADVAAGRAPGNDVLLVDLSSSERRRLRDYFRAVADIQTHVRTTYRVSD
jgi:CBS domain-containing protein